MQDTRRGNWSDEELAQIKDLVEKSGNNINWQQIGVELNRCESKQPSSGAARVDGSCCSTVTNGHSTASCHEGVEVFMRCRSLHR